MSADMHLNIDGDASSVCLRFFEAGKTSGLAECAADNHGGAWDCGYFAGSADGKRLGTSRGRRQGAYAAMAAIAGLLSLVVWVWRR